MSAQTLRRAAVVAVVATALIMVAQVALRNAYPQARGSIDGLTLLPMLVALTAVGGLIIVRLPHNVYGWLLVSVAAAWALNGLAIDYTALAVVRDLPAAHAAAIVATFLAAYAWGMFVTFGLLLYPTGALPSPRWRWVGVIAGAGVAFMSLGLGSAAVTSDASGVLRQFQQGAEVTVFGLPRILNEIGHVGVFFGLLAGVVSLIARARRANAVERLQLKWFGYGAFVIALSILVQLAPVAQAISWLEVVSMTAMPVVIGIAVTRWHLYDIDRVISRTVAYAALTLLLVGIYLGAVTSLTAVTAPVTGQSPIAVAAATLLAAAAFQPARRRIQATVDRRFNRARYDARRTISAFAAQLRDEVDMEDVQTHLLTTVDAVLQPRHVTVWLSPKAVQP